MKFNPTILLSIAALGISGCAADRAINKAKPTAFLIATGKANSGKIRRLPFERSWRDPAFDASKYSGIVFLPVTTSYLRTDQWEQSVSTYVPDQHTFVARAKTLAKYWDGSIRSAFSSPQNRLAVVSDAKQPGTLVVQIAMTEVVFGRPAANAASYAVMGGGVAFSALFSPSVAFEARVTDGATGQLVATISDRRSDKIRVIDVNKLTFTKSNEKICDEWSGEFMQGFNKALFPTVQRSWLSLY